MKGADNFRDVYVKYMKHAGVVITNDGSTNGELNLNECRNIFTNTLDKTGYTQEDRKKFAEKLEVYYNNVVTEPCENLTPELLADFLKFDQILRYKFEKDNKILESGDLSESTKKVVDAFLETGVRITSDDIRYSDTESDSWIYSKHRNYIIDKGAEIDKKLLEKKPSTTAIVAASSLILKRPINNITSGATKPETIAENAKKQKTI